ncbi:MAG: outer membrane protein assembly factor BamD, partial [Myxococcota bacterium]|nr:outer membrane protein assembly factor BamD [Myxococcota bacterium]
PATLPPVAPGRPGPGTDPEAQVIERARVALARGRTDDALRTLMSHERRFPAGQLAEERDVLLIEAYVAAGDLRLARDRIAHYRATYPDGLHRAKVAATAADVERAGAP